MNKRVILYLTSPNSWGRSKMSLENFKQLKKLGYDIITLTTNDCLPKYFYDHSTLVIHDYTDQSCDRKHYYKYFKKTNGRGFFTWQANSVHTCNFFTKTHFPSLVRNMRTLIQCAESMNYDEYFYCEDDHFFHDDDLTRLNFHFSDLSKNDLVVFKFNFDPKDDSTSVYCSYFHFAKLQKMNEIIKNFAYSIKEFLNDPDLYLHAFETTFKNLILRYKPENFIILEKTNHLSTVFPKSNINMVYSYSNIDDESRCNFIKEVSINRNLFYYHTIGLKINVNLKIFINDNLHTEVDLVPCSWYAIHIDDNSINDVKLIFNNKIIKTFKNLNVNDIIYNGELV